MVQHFIGVKIEIFSLCGGGIVIIFSILASFITNKLFGNMQSPIDPEWYIMYHSGSYAFKDNETSHGKTKSTIYKSFVHDFARCNNCIVFLYGRS